MSDLSQGPGWWLASDGKWYAPELHPGLRGHRLSPGWWQASDGSWYPPEQHPDAVMAPGDTPASVDTVHAVETTDSPNAQWRPDPFGRFESRRFFLGQPTSLVKNGDIVGYDESTSRRVGARIERASRGCGRCRSAD